MENLTQELREKYVAFRFNPKIEISFLKQVIANLISANVIEGKNENFIKYHLTKGDGGFKFETRDGWPSRDFMIKSVMHAIFTQTLKNMTLDELENNPFVFDFDPFAFYLSILR